MTASRQPFLNKISKPWEIDPSVELIIIDLFCGAGGTSLGFEQAKLNGKKIARIIACINHDPVAILSHWRNHPDVFHFEEDIRSLDLSRLVEILQEARIKYPNAKVVLWASLECTNFSKAKGGQERDADSRTLAKSLYMLWDEKLNVDGHDGYYEGNSYLQLLQPDYIMIENVVEFMSWGEMKNGKPVSRKNGMEWLKWREEIKKLGYHDGWKELNSADFGAHTSRNRIFGTFAKTGLPIIYPQPTHAKNPKAGMFKHLKKHRPVKEVLNFAEEGDSIFDVMHEKTYKQALAYLNIKKKKKESNKGVEALPRTIVLFPATVENPQYGMQPSVAITEKEVGKFDDYIESYLVVTGLTIEQIKFYRYDPFSEKTFERLYAGCIKFVAGGKQSFLLKYNSVNGKTGKYVPPSTDEPCPVISTQGRLNLVQTSFIMKYYSGSPEDKNISIDQPAGTITCKDGQALVQPKFIMKYYSGRPEGKVISVEGPAGAICCAGTQSLVQPKFLDVIYGNGYASSINDPAPTLRTKDGVALVDPQFLLNYNHSSDSASINEPAPTIVCKDKLAKIQVNWLDKQFTGDKNNQSINQPSGAILPNDKHALVSAKYFVDRNFSQGGKNSSIEDPAGSIMTVPKMNLVKVEPFLMNTNFGNVGSSINDTCPTITADRHYHYLINPQWKSNHCTSTDQPCFTLIARMDKAPPYLVQVETGEIAIVIYETDSPYMQLIKEFMALYGIVDIKMRMLLISELKKIQGFPEKYFLEGTQTDQKKFIGNSVVPRIPKRMAEALVMRLREYKLNKAA